MLNRFTIKFRLYGIVALLILCFGGMICLAAGHVTRMKNLALEKVEAVILDQQKARLETAVTTIAQALGNQLPNLPDQTDKITYIRDTLDKIRFETDKSGYYFVYRDGVNQVNPLDRNLQGKDMSDLTDANGVRPIRELMSRAAEGGGFCTYEWDKPGKGPTPKLSYATMIPGTDLWIGTGVYLDNLAAYRAGVSALMSGKTRQMLFWIAGISSVLLVLLVLVSSSIVRHLTGSIRAMTGQLATILSGDLTGRLSLEGKDELAGLSRSLNRFIDKLDTLFRDLGNQSHTVTAMAMNLTGVSSQMAADTRATESRVGSAAAGAEEMRRGMARVSRLMVDTAAGTNVVAAATEEMTATIGQITELTEQSDRTAARTAAESRAAADTMAALDSLVRDIGQVTLTIRDVSDQTNLLALNATIEAARAGTAGRGFNVVAGEIKALACQTAAATLDIKEKIEAVQKQTSHALKGIRQVEAGAGQTSKAMGDIKMALGEQVLATEEIRNRILDTAAHVDQVTQAAATALDTAKTIAGEMALTRATSTEMAENSRSVHDSARQLNNTAARLNRMGSTFTTTSDRFLSGPAKSAHSLWRKRIAELISGETTLTPDQVTDHRSCDFGKWYFGQGMATLGRYATFQEIDGAHRRVHELARQIVLAVQEDKTVRAGEMNREFIKTTDQLFLLLDRLEEETEPDRSGTLLDLPSRRNLPDVREEKRLAAA